MIKEAVFKFIASCSFLFFFNSVDILAGSPLLNGEYYPSTILSQNFPNKPEHTAACMNFGETSYGHLTLGLRAGICTLFDPPPSIGFGFGADLRLSLSKPWTIEVYTDYYHTNILNLGYRNTIDFGVNILYTWVERPYLPHKFTPFLLGGISYNNNDIRAAAYYSGEYQNWSPWLDLGVGEQYNFIKRFAFSIEAYYAIPLATHPISYINQLPQREILMVKNQASFHPGGIFVVFSLNYTFGAD